jgi:hypothetical protein
MARPFASFWAEYGEDLKKGQKSLYQARRRAKAKSYYLANRDRMKAASNAYRKSHPQDPAARREWQRANEHKIRAYRKTYVAKRGLPYCRRKRFDAALLRKYGLSRDAYDAILLDSCGRCEICGEADSGARPGLSLDHCHTSGTPRGLLCTRCNSTIGYARDSREILASALAYLSKYTKR